MPFEDRSSSVTAFSSFDFFLYLAVDLRSLFTFLSSKLSEIKGRYHFLTLARRQILRCLIITFLLFIPESLLDGRHCSFDRSVEATLTRRALRRYLLLLYIKLLPQRYILLSIRQTLITLCSRTCNNRTYDYLFHVLCILSVKFVTSFNWLLLHELLLTLSLA